MFELRSSTAFRSCRRTGGCVTSGTGRAATRPGRSRGCGCRSSSESMRALSTSMRCIATVRPDHPFNSSASGTGGPTTPSSGWASCPLTQNGFVRVISQPGYANPMSMAEALDDPAIGSRRKPITSSGLTSFRWSDRTRIRSPHMLGPTPDHGHLSPGARGEERWSSGHLRQVDPASRRFAARSRGIS